MDPSRLFPLRSRSPVEMGGVGSPPMRWEEEMKEGLSHKAGSRSVLLPLHTALVLIFSLCCGENSGPSILLHKSPSRPRAPPRATRQPSPLCPPPASTHFLQKTLTVGLVRPPWLRVCASYPPLCTLDLSPCEPSAPMISTCVFSPGLGCKVHS